jgi:hypothetical protein
MQINGIIPAQMNPRERIGFAELSAQLADRFPVARCEELQSEILVYQSDFK